jgi:catalase
VVTPEQAVDAINERFGRHPGYRALHAKGTLCKGSFTAAPEAARLTRAAHFQGPPVDVTVRFSNGSGDPSWPDYTPAARGMATRFYLPDGSRTDLVALTAPRFPGRTPDDFVKLLRADKPGPARLLRLPAFLATHPRALGAALASAAALKPPPSYASCHYYAIHAFKWIDSGGGERYVRYRWLPEASDASISKKEAKKRGPDYLRREIRERLTREPVRFTLKLQLAMPEDRVDDPSAVWPDERETVVAGTLEVTGLEPGGEAGDDGLVFDPTRVTDGIELSEDPVLRFRPRAYAVSLERRSRTLRSADLDVEP